MDEVTAPGDRCRFCAEEIPSRAVACPFCGRSQAILPPPPTALGFPGYAAPVGAAPVAYYPPATGMGGTSPGMFVMNTTEVAAPPEQAMQHLVAAAAGAPGYSILPIGPTTLVLTRKYWPTWVIVVAIVGAFLFLLGLLALLYRETETLTISLTPAPLGAVVSISGSATPEMMGRVNAALAALAPRQP